MNGAHLITNKRCLKKMNSNIVHICFENLQKDSQNISYLHQVLNIKTLQVMEPKKEKNWQYDLLCSSCDFCKYKITIVSIVYTSRDSFYCVYTYELMSKMNLCMLIFANHCCTSLLEDQIIFLPSLMSFHTKYGLTSLRQIMKYL